jgi:hypothetical protein
VFQPLSLDLLRTWPNWWEKAPVELLHHYYTGVRTAQRTEVVVLNQVLADELNVGYEEFFNTTVESVNGRPVENMHHFVDMLEAARGRVELVTSDRFVVVLDVAEARAANLRILTRYHIQSDRSLDLRRDESLVVHAPAKKPRAQRAAARRR